MRGTLIATCVLSFSTLSGVLFGMNLPAQAAERFVVAAGASVPGISLIGQYVGQATGFFSDEGLDLQVEYTTGAPQATQLASSGTVDVSQAAVEPLIQGVSKGLRGKIILSTNRRMVFYIAVPEESSFESAASLDGKKIGVGSLGSAAIPIVRSILRTSGVDPNNVELAPVGFGAQALAAMQTGTVDALGLFAGAYYAFERTGVKLRYFEHPKLKSIGNSGFVASEETLATKQKQLCGFVRGYVKSMFFAKTNPEAALRMYWAAAPAAKPQGDDTVAVETGLKELMPNLADADFGFPPEAQYGRVNMEDLAAYIAIMEEEGQVGEALSTSEIATSDFVACANDFDPQEVIRKAETWPKG